MVFARLPGARGVACGRHIPRAALRPCTGRSFVGSRCPQSTGRLQRRVLSSCDTVLGRGRLRRDHFRAGDYLAGPSRGDGANRAGGDSCLAHCPCGVCRSYKRLRATSRGNFISGKHLERNCSCAFSAAFRVTTLQLAYLLRGGEIQRAHLALSACAVSSGRARFFFARATFC